MKSFFKRSAISVVVLGMAGSSYAAMSHANVNNSMWSPRLTGVFLGVEGLDLRAQNGDLDYVTVVPANPVAPSTAIGPYNNNAVSSSSYDWNWRVYGGLKFTDNDDVTVSWLQLNNSNNSTTGLFTGTTLVPRWVGAGPNLAAFSNVSARAKYNLNEAYGVWGHTINFNNPWSIRFAAGVEYAQLNSNLTVNGTIIAAPTNVVIGYKAKSKLNGWGPRLEIDTNYSLPYGFNWFARTNAVLLSSSRKVSLNALSNNFAVAPFPISSNFRTRNIVVPKLGMKIGVGYSYLFGQAGAEGVCGTTLTLEAGWQADTYIHAIERPDDGFVSTGRAVPFTTTLAETKVSNFTDQGLFLGLKVSSDWL